jgi:hypothetical protein
MLIFRRIFNFEQTKVDQLEKRLNLRYVPGPGFPLRASVHHGGRDHTAKILDVSSNGVGLLVAHDTGISAGYHLRVDLVLGQHRLEFEARIAHLQPREEGLYLGLGLVFAEFELQKTYLQLLQPIVIGQTLQPMAMDRVIQDEPRFSKQVYTGDPDVLLTVRREQMTGTPLHSFEFQLPDSFCRGIMRQGTVAPYALESMEASAAEQSQAVFETSGGLHDEIRQLFRWILPNLSLSLPEDVRAFLQRFAS